ncbi:low temperature requirement protein A [Cohnella nanjingensis]|uniref:Low temperature requirement protein A n=1 Tax=Cohnella nanjingensis TaxID=1387779 RepID=A0A7X0RRW1_9BACL|nr:low temperature requirement protein A [Cohnella nanjingensis]MBB6672411.1 low temperature requirement protein A [Cohnella nanjingensis]
MCGESILVTGATFAKLDWNPTTLGAFAVSFAGTVAMWWIYFEMTSKIGHHYIAHAADPGRVARSAYTYTHLLLVAGIILSAVSDELLLAHPSGHIDAKTAAVMLGGPGLYLLGNLLFMRIVAKVVPLPSLAGVMALAALIPFAGELTPMLLSAAASLVLVIVSVWGGAFSERLCRLVPSAAHRHES